MKSFIWEFPKIGGTFFWGPYNKDPTIQGAILGSPIFGNSHTTKFNDLPTWQQDWRADNCSILSSQAPRSRHLGLKHQYDDDDDDGNDDDDDEKSNDGDSGVDKDTGDGRHDEHDYDSNDADPFAGTL